MSTLTLHVEHARRATRTRARLQSLLWASVPLVIMVIIGGQFWPYLGFIVPVARLTGMVGRPPGLTPLRQSRPRGGRGELTEAESIYTCGKGAGNPRGGGIVLDT